MDLDKMNYYLLTILQYHAPTADAQQACTAMFNKAIADGASKEELHKTLSGALNDGLKYGNWPWSKKEERVAPYANPR